MEPGLHLGVCVVFWLWEVFGLGGSRDGSSP